jgi:hypothetical protein
MADEGTLATTAQVLLAIGQSASATQILEANTNIWILMAESDMEKAFGKLGATPELVANYASIRASYKQWLAMVASNRAAFYAINQNQNTWGLATSQSKLNVLDSIWTGFLSDLKENSSEIVTMMGL